MIATAIILTGIGSYAMRAFFIFALASTGPTTGTGYTFGMRSCGSLVSHFWRSILMVGETRLIMKCQEISRIEPF